ncbi:histidine phosphatase family protein [Psychrobacter sp. N25K4-3-2]|uniref:histidine phosphatase family protein n=1 Tax=Psychrobacter sp. N25K4-3-2 TaxID=2785026 RepID=UPI00188C8AD4|nr:histidine phosphatase family protein [Psychrobacter sp. N25K4-3-2]MBF4489352.1 histidine phosphatase family protein [Psychrobacter sp. N25K4-3-2]
MTTILLARHGQASFGQENYDQLSELGSIQAQMLGQHYATTQRRIDAIFSGSLVRQQDSARHFWESYQSSMDNSNEAPILAALDINEPDSYIIPQFDEFNHKDVLVKSNPAFASKAAIAIEIAKADVPATRLAELFDRAMQRWHAGDDDHDYLESWSQFSSRAQQAVEQIRMQVASLSLDHHSTVLVFTSGGVIAAITAQLLQQGSQTAYQLNKSLVNTGVTSITLKDQSTRLMSLNEYSHLFADGKRFVTWR